MGSYDKFKRGIYIKERESLPLIQRRKKRSKRTYREANKNGIYLAIKVIPDGAYVFCGKEE